MDSGFRRNDRRDGGVYTNLRANGRRGGDVDSGFRRKDGSDDVQCALRNWRANGHLGATWIPAKAGKTGGGGVYANWRAYGHLGATWIPAKAGKTEGKLRNGSCLRGGPPTLPGVLSCTLIWEPRVAGPAIRTHGPPVALSLRRRPFPQSEARWAGPRSLVRKAPKSPDAR